MNVARFSVLPLLGVLLCQPAEAVAQTADKTELAGALTTLSAEVISGDARTRLRDQTWRSLRKRGDAANRRDAAAWRAVDSRESWEQLRDRRLSDLRAALGSFPDPPRQLDIRVTKRFEGDGFVIENLVYRTRPNFWVTANLYSPISRHGKSPGILIVHSHHRPKTQGELQDMGMTWARQGCVVLVIDLVGHGERADHPFRGEQDYQKRDSGYRWWRQDYYYRFDTNAQLHLVGESLMGWMAWDLMRGVDLLIARPDVDADRIAILGAVAGGGDVAAVTAALDGRIAAAVPFNFGGPQPETRFPLPEDADLRFNYLGGAYWEGTRNLRRTGADGFFAWIIVGGIAPRGLIYAHEFAWDKERDPVWKRLNRLYGFYDAPDKIDFTLGRGSVKGRPPEATHCTNIGKHHRQRIHPAFKRWFGVNVDVADEYSQRLEADDLRSMTDDARRELQPKRLYELVAEIAGRQVKAARRRLLAMPASKRRTQLRSDWKRRLGDIRPQREIEVLSRKMEHIDNNAILVERIALRTEPEITIPLILLVPAGRDLKRSRTVVAVAQSGKESFLRQRSHEIAELLDQGAVVCLPDVRGAGAPRGSRGEHDSTSYYALLFETPLLGYRLRDLRAVFRYLRSRGDLSSSGFALWGDTFTPPNPRETVFQTPKRVAQRPRFSEPLGGLLAMLGALYEDDVKAVYVHGGLGRYQDVLSSPYVYAPHDVIVPGLLNHGDLADLAACLDPRPLRLEGLVDGWNQALTEDRIRSLYQPASRAYQATNPGGITFAANRTSPARWLLPTAKP